jgi:hypothetical protein
MSHKNISVSWDGARAHGLHVDRAVLKHLENTGMHGITVVSVYMGLEVNGWCYVDILYTSDAVRSTIKQEAPESPNGNTRRNFLPTAYYIQWYLRSLWNRQDERRGMKVREPKLVERSWTVEA